MEWQLGKTANLNSKFMTKEDKIVKWFVITLFTITNGWIFIHYLYKIMSQS